MDRGTENIRRVLASSRYFIALSSLGMFIASVALHIFGTIAVVEIIWDTTADGDISEKVVKHLAVEFIGLADAFLLGTVLYIVALGLYELFVDPDLPMPGWLRIETLDDLKERMIGVIIVMLAVTFAGYIVEWDGDTNILYLGAAVALVIAALGFVLAFAMRHGSSGTPDDQHRDTQH